MSLINVGEVKQGVLGGLDGYLFLFDGGQQQFAHLVGDQIPSPASVENFFENLESRHSYCEAKGIAYLHVVFPSKPVIVTEKLPPQWRSRVKSLFLTRYLATRSEGCPPWLFYPRDFLRELDAKRSVFKKLDTHLSNFGSLSVARWMLQKIGLDYKPEEYFSEMSAEFTGDLARMLGVTDTIPGIRIQSMLPNFLVDNRSALPGNTNHIVVLHNPNTASEKRLLIFGDSFSQGALIYLAPSFRDIVYVRSATFQTDLVELIGPDVVFSANAERYLSKVDSDRESSSVLMAVYGTDGYRPSEAFRKALTAQLAWRYHRSVYERWRQQQNQPALHIGALGFCRPNDQIKVLDVPNGRFQSLGKDPFFFFPRLPLKAGRQYLLEMRMESEVASAANVYFQKGEGTNFNESCVVRANVFIGENKLSFRLDNEQLGSALRLDPLTCAGCFSITDLVLIELPVDL